MNVRLCTIGDFVEPVSTWSPAAKPTTDFSYVDLSAIDQTEKTIRLASIIRGSEAPSRARQLIKKGDVLVSTVRPNLNGVALVTNEFEGATASTGFCVLRPRRDKLSSSYLFHWTRSPQFVELMGRQATGASYPAVSDRIVKGSLMPLPPLDEQRRIAAILDRADALRRKRKRALDIAKFLPSEIFAEMFGSCKPGTHDWPIRQVADVGNVQLGRQRAPKYQTGKFARRYMRVANVFEDRIDTSDVLAMDFDNRDFGDYKLEFGDILLNEGQSTELVGRPAMWREELEDCCFQNTLVRFQANRDYVVPEFALGLFLQYFRSGGFAKISSKTSSVAHLGAGRFARMPFPLPPLGLQREFAKRVAVANKLRDVSGLGLDKLNSAFSSLQHRAFSGQL